MSTKSKLSSESKAVLKWTGVTLEELAEEFDYSTDEAQLLMDDPAQRAHLLASINSVRQSKVWKATLNRMMDLISNLPEEFDSFHRDRLGEIYCYVLNALKKD